MKANPDAGRESLCSQMEKLIVGPPKATHIPTLIIIDALNECKDEQPAFAILSILSRYVNELPTVRFFITGCPEARIRTGFRLKSLLPVTEVFKLHEVKPEAVDSDIRLFFQTQLTNLVENQSDCDTTGDWPSSSDIKVLCKKAAGFFIYASTIIKFVASENSVPTQALALITSLPQSTVEEGRSGIDQLYIEVLEQAFHNIHVDNTQCYHSFWTGGDGVAHPQPPSNQGTLRAPRLWYTIYLQHYLLPPFSPPYPRQPGEPNLYFPQVIS